MEAAALCLLLLLNLLESGSAQVSLTVSPSRSQFFKFDSFSVSCEVEDEDEGSGWVVMKRAVDGEVQACPYPCSIPAAFPSTDSGLYWCEPGQEAGSTAVNITVTAGSVILEGPVLPVTEGLSVTLCCRIKALLSACSPGADFYKDGVLIKTSSTGNMTIANVSTSHEGAYKCSVSGSGHSPESWLGVRAPADASDPSRPLMSHLRHLLVGSLYLVSTILLGLVYRDRRREQQQLRLRPDGVIV